MIPAPNSYFLTEEARQYGARPVVRFTFFPHNFQHGVEAGAGTYVACSFVPQERVQVDADAGSASWTSPELAEAQMQYPVAVQASWEEDFPGYDFALYLRTAESQGGLVSASWLALVQEGEYNLYQWHQLKAEWIIFRGWAFDTEQSENPAQAYAVDSAPDPYLSYASDGVGGVAYVDQIRLVGEYGLNDREVLDSGSLFLDRPVDFRDLVAADHTLILDNRSDKFNPRSPDFIFPGSLPWYGKHLRIRFGYERPGFRGVADLITLYEGKVLKWGPVRRQARDSQEIPAVEIYSRDFISEVLKKPLGTPNDEGDPNPAIFGELLLQAEELADKNPFTPDCTAGFETGDLSELTNTYTSGGTLEISSLTPRAGLKCLRATVTGADGYAYGTLALNATKNRVLFSAWVKIISCPEVPGDKLTRFLGLSTISVDRISLYLDKDKKVWVYLPYYTAWIETDFTFAGYEGSWVKISVGLIGLNPGNLKVWANGEEVLNWGPYDFTGCSSLAYGWVGLRRTGSAEEWVLDIDEAKIWPSCYFQMYWVPGGPFQEIKAVYAKGVLKQARRFAWVYIGGERYGGDYIAYPAVGAVHFPDLNNPPTAPIMVRVRKNDLDHPVQVLQALLEIAGLSDKVNSAAFAGAQAATPGDIVGCRFEDTTVGQAIQEIAGKCLLDVWMDQGQIFCRAYTASPPADPVLTLYDARIKEDALTYDLDNLKNKVRSTYGYHERNQDLFYLDKDEQLISLLGELEETVSWEWGEAVATDLGEMVKQKNNWLWIRLKAPTETLEMTGPLGLARLELGDAVKYKDLNAEVFGKRLRFSPDWGVELKILRFLGE